MKEGRDKEVPPLFARDVNRGVSKISVSRRMEWSVLAAKSRISPCSWYVESQHSGLTKLRDSSICTELFSRQLVGLHVC